MLRLVLLVVLALALTAAVPWLSRRRVVCPMSAALGLAAGLAWALVVVAS